MGRPGKSRFQRAARARARLRSEQAFSLAPHSFVFPRGRAGRSLRALCRDLRRVLEPYTARNLQVRRSNSLRDLVAVAGPLGVSHFLTLSKSQSGVNLKLFRLPGGPTLTFKVLQYSLVRDVVSSLRRHRMHEQQFLQPPLLVLGGFGARPQLGLVAGMFQGMFPALNVHTVKLNSIRRCLLISCDADSQLLEFRHYAVQVLPLGLSRGLRRILRHKFPDLGRARDVSQLLTGEVAVSESEAEPDASQKVPELAQNCAGRGNAVTQQSAIRLTEVGPRLTLQLLKVEEGLGQGDVLYHALAPKGEAELQVLRARREQRLQVRLERRRRQEQDLERKRQQRERHRERSLAGMGRAAGGDTRGDTRGDARGGPGGPAGDSDAEDPGAPEAGEAEASDEDEAEYYRQELGEEPDADLFPGCSKRKRSPSAAPRARKRRKRSPKSQKSTPGSQKSTPGTPKSQNSRPGAPKFTSGTPKSQKLRTGSQKSTPGTPKFTSGTPKSHPGNPKFRPGTPKSQRGTPKSHPGTPKSQHGIPKSTPGTPKSHPGQPKNPKSHPRKPGTPKSQRESPKSQPGTSRSHPGHPKNPKSNPKNPKSNPKNPKSRRGKLLSPQKIPNFPRPGKARKRKK